MSKPYLELDSSHKTIRDEASKDAEDGSKIVDRIYHQIFSTNMLLKDRLSEETLDSIRDSKDKISLKILSEYPDEFLRKVGLLAPKHDLDDWIPATSKKSSKKTRQSQSATRKKQNRNQRKKTTSTPGENPVQLFEQENNSQIVELLNPVHLSSPKPVAKTISQTEAEPELKAKIEDEPEFDEKSWIEEQRRLSQEKNKTKIDVDHSNPVHQEALSLTGGAAKTFLAAQGNRTYTVRNRDLYQLIAQLKGTIRTFRGNGSAFSFSIPSYSYDGSGKIGFDQESPHVFRLDIAHNGSDSINFVALKRFLGPALQRSRIIQN